MRRARPGARDRPDRLRLDRTTLRRLDERELDQVAGAGKNSGKYCTTTTKLTA